MIAYARADDTVLIASMDRLGRSVIDLNQIVRELLTKGVTVEFVAERVTFRPERADVFADFQLNIMASFAQLERSISRERQAQGIASAKARGAYRGRSPKLLREQLTEARDLVASGVPKAAVARRFGVDRTTLHRALRRLVDPPPAG